MKTNKDDAVCHECGKELPKYWTTAKSYGRVDPTTDKEHPVCKHCFDNWLT